MTEEEFGARYFYLWQKYPDHYTTERKGKLFEIVKNMPFAWFKAKVSQVLNRGIPDFSWKNAVASYLEEPTKYKQTKEALADLDEIKEHSTEEGYEKFLKENGVQSVTELIEKKIGGKS